jgi:hypothetical protein
MSDNNNHQELHTLKKKTVGNDNCLVISKSQSRKARAWKSLNSITMTVHVHESLQKSLTLSEFW